MERLFFVLAIALLSFLYGAATIQLEIFPYKLMREAKLGWEAWANAETQKKNFPQHFEEFVDTAAAVPQAKRLGEGMGAEHVLVTGGPYELMERCPTWGCIAWIADRSGKVLHSWEVNLEELWNGLTGISGDVNILSLYPVGMALDRTGSLVVSFQGRETYPIQIGIMKVDRDGRILWKRFDRSHHWITMDSNGDIYAPYASHVPMKRIGPTSVPMECNTGQSGVDAIRVLGGDGKPLREIPLLDNFVRAGYHGLFYALRDGCNPTHLNSIALASRDIGKHIPGAAAGDLLVSLRETSTVALLDGTSGMVKRAVSGRTAAQHAPQFLPDGTVLVFDNLGGNAALGGTRVVRMNLVDGTATTVFPREDAGPGPNPEQQADMDATKSLLPVHSRNAGHINVSPDGKRALVSVTHQGRIIEIDVESGTPLWVYENTHEIGKFLESRGLSTARTRARFATFGAYYVPRNLEFFKERS